MGSDWPLSGKFGAQPEEAEEIIALAAELKADLAGVTFHVGSQCRNADNWRVGIESAKRAMRKMRLKGLKPRLLNIGGGFPVRHTKPIPSIEVIGEVVNRALAGLPDGVRVMAEPGRYLVSDAGWFVCRVAGTATRSGKRWAYFDAGMFGGIIETTEGLQYDVVTDRTGRLVPWTVAGPDLRLGGCVMRDQLLPEDLAGRRLRLHPQRGRLHDGLREQLQRLSAAGGADLDGLSVAPAGATRHAGRTALRHGRADMARPFSCCWRRRLRLAAP